MRAAAIAAQEAFAALTMIFSKVRSSSHLISEKNAALPDCVAITQFLIVCPPPSKAATAIGVQFFPRKSMSAASLYAPVSFILKSCSAEVIV